MAARGRRADDCPAGDPWVVRSKLSGARLRRDPCAGGIVVALGSRVVCSGCDHPIPASEVEVRTRFADGERLRFHARCFAIWYEQTQSHRVGWR